MNSLGQQNKRKIGKAIDKINKRGCAERRDSATEGKEGGGLFFSPNTCVGKSVGAYPNEKS